MIIEEFIGDGKRLFSLMYDIIGRVKENVLPDSGTSEQDLASKFCNFCVDKIANIIGILKDDSRFVVQKRKRTGNARIQAGSRVLCSKDNRGSKALNCRTDPISTKLIKKFKFTSLQSLQP